MSNGAMMSYRFACQSPLRLAAIGPVAGSLESDCTGAKPTSVLAIHGLSDRFAPYAGGVGLGNDRDPHRSVPDSIAYWQKRDGCGAPLERTRGDVTTSIARCEGERVVELLTIAHAGHQWPGGAPPSAREQAVLEAVAGFELDQPSGAIDATQTLWQFFAEHRAES